MSLKKSPAWFNFALFVKIRDGFTCFTCGKKVKGQGLGAGHFIQAFGHQNTFFDPTNVHAQCTYCNLTLNGNLLEYRRRIIEKYGEGYDELLEKRGRIYKQWTKRELKDLSLLYKQKIVELEK